MKTTVFPLVKGTAFVQDMKVFAVLSDPAIDVEVSATPSTVTVPGTVMSAVDPR